MDEQCFDELTRSAADGTRRAMVRILAGGVLGVLVARHGSTEDARAKPKRRKEPLQAEGRSKGKGKGRRGRRDRPKPPPLPPGCQSCGECEMCQDGACAPDPDLEGVFCTESGEPCGTCIGGACVPSPEETCDDGSCRPNGGCCPEHYQCDDGVCIDPLEMCCPDQRFCGEGLCVGEDECCPNVPQPECGQCAVVCDGGAWACRPGESNECPGDQAFNCETGQCQCKNPALDCGNGTCCPLWDPTWFCHEGKCCTYWAGGSSLFCQ